MAGEELKTLASDLLNLPEFTRIEKYYPKHARILKFLYNSRKRELPEELNYLNHSLRVAELSYKFAKRLSADMRASVRAAVYHDMFIEYGYNHPSLSAEFARERGEGKEIVKAIETHMSIPRNKIGLVLWVSDKYDSLRRYGYFVKGLI